MSKIFDLAFMWFVIVLCCPFVCLELISWGTTIVVYTLLLIFCPITVRHIISLRALQPFRVQTPFFFFWVFRPINRGMFGEIIKAPKHCARLILLVAPISLILDQITANKLSKIIIIFLKAKLYDYFVVKLCYGMLELKCWREH